MPQYPYECNCGNEFYVTKMFSEIDRVETCPACGELLPNNFRKIARTNIDKSAAEAWNKLEYQPAFGKYLTVPQARKLAKRQGMDEVGTEPPEKIHKHYAQQRKKHRDEIWEKM